MERVSQNRAKFVYRNWATLKMFDKIKETKRKKKPSSIDDDDFDSVPMNRSIYRSLFFLFFIEIVHICLATLCLQLIAIYHIVDVACKLSGMRHAMTYTITHFDILTERRAFIHFASKLIFFCFRLYSFSQSHTVIYLLCHSKCTIGASRT